MIDFCHISPTEYLQELFPVEEPRTHLVLAHLVEEDPGYADFYSNLHDNGHTIIMDNSAFEMYKQGNPMYPTEKLIEMAWQCNADYVVMSDYPGEPFTKTIDAAEKMIPQLKKEDLKTFFCPQSEPGDVNGLLFGYKWALGNNDVDYIAFSILNIPLAYECEKHNKLQKYLSRYHFMRLIEEKGLLPNLLSKKVHFLGMTEGPNEIALMGPYADFIDTWDSSAAVWAGLNGIQFDNSPTGLVNGKFEVEVDFYHNSSYNLDIAKKNIDYIEELCRGAR